jgi:putative ABC transport system substrate-binding protein
MRRREFIAGLGGAAVSPIAPHAQQAAVPVIGWLDPTSPEARRDLVAAFHRGLAESGYVEGRNVTIERRWAYGQNDRLPALAADLVRRQVTVIAAAGSTPGALAAKAATARIPIVFMVGADPIEIGLVASLNNPGGNLTGISLLNAVLAAKRVELLHKLLPAAMSIALLIDPTDPVLSEVETKAVQIAARVLGVHLLVLKASSQSPIEAAFATLVQQRAGALLVGPNAFLITAADQIVALAARYAVPTIYTLREFVVAGGLISYAGDIRSAWRQAGGYTGRILKGEKPADLPVQQVTKIELVINLKTAKVLGLEVPPDVLVRADEVIE